MDRHSTTFQLGNRTYDPANLLTAAAEGSRFTYDITSRGGADHEYGFQRGGTLALVENQKTRAGQPTERPALDSSSVSDKSRTMEPNPLALLAEISGHRNI